MFNVPKYNFTIHWEFSSHLKPHVILNTSQTSVSFRQLQSEYQRKNLKSPVFDVRCHSAIAFKFGEYVVQLLRYYPKIVDFPKRYGQLIQPNIG
jgi:hypothetical protein